MEQLLFQEPLFIWLGAFSLQNMIITLIIGCVVFLGMRLFREKKVRQINTIDIYERVMPKDILEKYIFIIKDHLQTLHPEREVFAQTAIEIGKYHNQNELIDILKELEAIEYSGKNLSKTERETIENSIGKFINNRKKYGI